MPTTTFTITVDSQDGTGFRQSGTWATISSGAYTAEDATLLSYDQELIGPSTFVVYCGYMRFDTSSLPDDAIITSAALKLYAVNKGDDESKKFAFDYFDFGGEPSVAADWELTSSGDAVSSVTVASIILGVVNTIALTGLSGISKTGITGIRIGPFDSIQPTGTNFADFAASEHATGAPPQLDVTYTTETEPRRFRIRRSRGTTW